MPLLWLTSQSKAIPCLQQEMCKLWEAQPLLQMQKHDRQKERMQAVNEEHQSDHESCKGSDDKINRAVDMVTIKCFNFNSIHPVIFLDLNVITLI